jgi:hypothetical protein
MQFSAYLSGPLPEVAPHKLSRTLAMAALRCGLARKIGQNAVQIVNGMSIRQVKDYLRGTGTGPAQIERINPPGYHCLPYTFPLPYDLLRHYQ